MKTYTTEEAAKNSMRLKNRAHERAGSGKIHVMVDGPDDGEYTIMELAEAQESGFDGYRVEF